MLADINSVADAKGVAYVMSSVANKTHAFGVKWGGYHELFVGSVMKSNGFTIKEFDLKVPKTKKLQSTDIDVVATRPDSSMTFFIQAKATVGAFFGKDGKAVLKSDPDEFTRVAQTRAAGWSEKVKNVDENAMRVWIDSDVSEELPTALRKFIEEELDGDVGHYPWPGNSIA